MDRKSMDRKSADKGLTFIKLLYDADPAGGACHQNRYGECLGAVGAGTASTNDGIQNLNRNNTLRGSTSNYT